MAQLDEATRKEIGQHFVFGFHGHDVSPDAERLIKEYYVGNIILMKRNVESFQQVHALTAKLQNIAKEAGNDVPLLIGTDQENGLVSAFSKEDAGTQFPGAMAIAATQSPELAEEVAFASGEELRMAGINWTYSPVCDVNSDPRNPVIGVRSFGDDPHEVAQYASAVSRGLTRALVAPSPKHFPGHGDTHVDSHLALPSISKTLDEINATELVPFAELITKGDSEGNQVASLMTGHMALPLITGDDTPSSLSKAITTDLLRGKLGYEGVVVTDCLEMEAVAKTYGSEEGAVRSLEAGADVVMICHTMERQAGAVEATYEAVRNGRLGMGELRRGGDRVREMKKRFAGTWEDVAERSVQLDAVALGEQKARNAELSKRAYAASTAVISDAGSVLPLAKVGTVYVFTPQAEGINLAVDDADGILRDKSGRVRNTAGPSFVAFAQSIAKRVAAEHVVYTKSASDGLPEGLGAATAIVFATRNAHTSAWQLEYLRRVRGGYPSVRTVVMATCGPYDFADADDLDGLARLATFEFTVPALEAAAAVVFGEGEGKGRVPVKSS